MPNPLLAGNVGRGPSAHGAWPWERSRASGELFAERIMASQLSIGKELAEGNALPPPPEIGTVLRRDDPPRANSKLWNTFKQTMKREYNMNDKWLETRAGPLKTLFGDLHHLRKYLQGLSLDEAKLGSYIKDIREATVRSMNDISRFNDVTIGGPSEQDPEQEDLVRKLTEWFQ